MSLLDPLLDWQRPDEPIVPDEIAPAWFRRVLGFVGGVIGAGLWYVEWAASLATGISDPYPYECFVIPPLMCLMGFGTALFPQMTKDPKADSREFPKLTRTWQVITVLAVTAGIANWLAILWVSR